MTLSENFFFQAAKLSTMKSSLGGKKKKKQAVEVYVFFKTSAVAHKKDVCGSVYSLVYIGIKMSFNKK